MLDLSVLKQRGNLWTHSATRLCALPRRDDYKQPETYYTANMGAGPKFPADEREKGDTPMHMLLLGVKPLDFESNGERIKGTQAFVGYAEDGVTGQRTDKLFFRDGFELPDLKPGMTLDVAFNHRGKPEKVTAVSAPQRLNLSKQQ